MINILGVKLSDNLVNDIKCRSLKAVDLVQHVLNNIEESETNKPIRQTALKDIKFYGKYFIEWAEIDNIDNILYLHFDKNVSIPV